MADLGRPASIQDEVKPWRMLAARAIHLGDQCGGLGLGSVIPTARAARDHGGKGDAHAQREIGREKGHGALLTTPGCCDDGWRPRIEGAGVESRWRKVGWRRRCPRVERRRCPRVERRHAALGHRGKLREAVAAEGKRERAAAAKKGGAVLGVRVVHTTAPAPPADALRLDPIRARACF
jgi:hypothetical protein